MDDTTLLLSGIIGTGAAVILCGVATLTFFAKQLSGRINDLKTDTTKGIDEVRADVKSLNSEMHQRFDQVNRELAENRERMAKLEGALEGFLAGRRDRDAA